MLISIKSKKAITLQNVLRSFQSILPSLRNTKNKKESCQGQWQTKLFCKDCHKQVQFKYTYQGINPLIKRQSPAIAMRASSIRDIATVLKISTVTVILTLRLWFKTHTEPQFEGIYENVILDEFWSWVGKSIMYPKI